MEISRTHCRNSQFVQLQATSYLISGRNITPEHSQSQTIFLLISIRSYHVSLINHGRIKWWRPRRPRREPHAEPDTKVLNAVAKGRQRRACDKRNSIWNPGSGDRVVTATRAATRMPDSARASFGRMLFARSLRSPSCRFSRTQQVLTRSVGQKSTCVPQVQTRPE